MTRLERRNRTDIIIKTKGGLFDLIDNAVKSQWRINDKEYNFICANCTDAELKYLVDFECQPFSQKRKSLIVINNLLNQYANTTC